MQRNSTELPFFINGYTFLVGLAFFFSLSFSYTELNINNSGGNGDFSVLLAFKSSSDISSNSLVSWTFGNGSNPCSSWVGVSCHPITRRVTKLVLNNLNLTGSIQTLALLRQLRHLSLHHNHLSSTTLDFTAWPDLRHLYLSHNHFTGKFPSGISQLRGLRRLDLSYNGFYGEIPFSELTRLSHLLTLRLEFNSFNGTLSSVESSSSSSFLKSSLSDFNVSENALAGKIPDSLSNFQASAFAGNLHLCGKPLLTNCPVKPAAARGPLPIGVTDINQKNRKKHSKTDTILMIIAIDAASLLLIILTIGFCCYYKKKYRDQKKIKNQAKRFINNNTTYSTTMDDASGEMVFFEGCKGFSRVDELLKASAEMLGKGTVGTTYRVVMDGGGRDGDVVVVVKRIREKVKRVKEIGGCLREIGGIRHPNVVSLRAYYSSKEELLLVYDFVQNGSLHNLLHGNRGPGRTPLDWPRRLRFALGSAEGLAFIHGGYTTNTKSKLHLHHGHLTSSNIVIDDNGNACIADVGLHQIIMQQTFTSSNNAYLAPELLMLINNNGNGATRKLSAMQKCDVYSFGVILLEILTGKMTTTTMTSRGEMMRLNKLVGGRGRGGEKEEWKWDVFDIELVRHKEMEKEMIELLKVAMLCLALCPKDRPKMSDVCKMIQHINGATKTTVLAASAMDQHSSHSSNSV